MSNPIITRLQDEQADREQFVQRILDEADAEQRSLTDSEVANIEATRERLAAIGEQLTPLLSWEESRTAAQQINRRVSVMQKTQDVVKSVDPLPLEGRTLGSAFVQSSEFRGRKHGQGVDFVDFPTSFAELRAPALLDTQHMPGQAFLPSPEKYILGSPMSAFRLYDAVGKIMVGTGSVVMATMGTLAGAKTPAKVLEAGLKPEVEVTAAQTTVNLEKWSGWVHITEELLEDGASNGIRGYIDGELVRGIMTQLELEIVAKLKAANITVVTGKSGQPIEEVIRMSVATVEAQGYTPTAVAINPADAAGIDIAAAKLGGATAYGTNVSPWGLRVVPSPSIAAGEAFIGDFDTGVKLLERTPIRVGITGTDQDDWVHNLYKIKAEVRAAAHVGVPLALAKTKLTP